MLCVFKHTFTAWLELTVVCFVDKGEVFGWGNNEYKQLSDKEDLQQVNCPMHLSSTYKLGRIVDITAGGSFCASLNGNLHYIFYST